MTSAGQSVGEKLPTAGRALAWSVVALRALFSDFLATPTQMNLHMIPVKPGAIDLRENQAALIAFKLILAELAGRGSRLHEGLFREKDDSDTGFIPPKRQTPEAWRLPDSRGLNLKTEKLSNDRRGLRRRRRNRHGRRLREEP